MGEPDAGGGVVPAVEVVLDAKERVEPPAGVADVRVHLAACLHAIAEAVVHKVADDRRCAGLIVVLYQILHRTQLVAHRPVNEAFVGGGIFVPGFTVDVAFFGQQLIDLRTPEITARQFGSGAVGRFEETSIGGGSIHCRGEGSCVLSIGFCLRWFVQFIENVSSHFKPFNDFRVIGEQIDHMC